MKKKDAIALIVAKMGKNKGSEEDTDEMMSESDDGDEMGYEAAADDVMSAIQEGDSAALAEALKSFIELCDHGE